MDAFSNREFFLSKKDEMKKSLQEEKNKNWGVAENFFQKYVVNGWEKKVEQAISRGRTRYNIFRYDDKNDEHVKFRNLAENIIVKNSFSELCEKTFAPAKVETYWCIKNTTTGRVVMTKCIHVSLDWEHLQEQESVITGETPAELFFSRFHSVIKGRKKTQQEKRQQILCEFVNDFTEKYVYPRWKQKVEQATLLRKTSTCIFWRNSADNLHEYKDLFTQLSRPGVMESLQEKLDKFFSPAVVSIYTSSKVVRIYLTWDTVE